MKLEEKKKKLQNHWHGIHMPFGETRLIVVVDVMSNRFIYSISLYGICFVFLALNRQ